MQALQSNPQPSQGHNLDKLGQIATDNTSNSLTLHFSKGTRSTDKPTISKRARSKYISDAIKLKLLQIDDSPLKESYEKSCTCASTMKVERGRVVTSYCKQRFCITCNRIRTGMLLNNYLPHIKASFKDPFFVTLTTPNCEAIDLKHTIQHQLSTFSKIARTMKKRIERASGGEKKFTAISKSECTYNSNKGNYHPHLHIIVDGYTEAYEVLGFWLKHYPEASVKAQDVRQADENSMKELLKYSTKMISELADGKKSKEVNIRALDTMFVAMKGIRLLRTYGNMHSIASASNDDDMNEQAEKDTQLALFDEQPRNAPSTGCYVWRSTDWYNTETGEALTNYRPAPKTLEFIGKMRL